MIGIRKILNLLSPKEKINFYILIFLMLINSLLEVLGLTAIIPLISITVNNDLSIFKDTFLFNFLYEFSKKDSFIFLSFIFVGIVFLFKNLFIIFYNYFLTNFHCKIAERFSNDIFNYYINIDYTDYLKLKTSKQIFDTTEAVEIFRNTLLNTTNFLLESIILFIIVSFLIYLNPTSTILILSLFALLFMCFYIFFTKQNFNWGQEVKNSSTNRINILNSTYISIRDVKIYSGENYFKSRFKKFNNKLRDLQKNHLFFITLPKPFFEIFIIIILLTFYIIS